VTETDICAETVPDVAVIVAFPKVRVGITSEVEARPLTVLSVVLS
jgi:hypothetical protein